MGNQISFTVLDSELQRQKIAETMYLALDPRGKADAIMVIVLSSIYFVDFLAVAFLLWNRNYPPLKSKGPILMTLMMASSAFWFVGDLIANGHLRTAGTIMNNCMAFGVWVRLLLGACTMCILTSFRAYGLYRVFFLNLPYHTIGLYLPFAITTPMLFVFLWLTWAVMIGVFWKIRNIKSSFNERREMMVTCTIIFGALVFMTIMNYTSQFYALKTTLRVVTTVLSHLATNALWWIIMAVPMYNCIFSRQEYVSQWILKLGKDGLQNEYDINPNATGGHSNIYLSSYNAHSNDSKEADSRLSSQNTFSRAPESPLYGNNDAAYIQGLQSMSAMERRQESIIIETRPESPTFNALNRY
ncbi:hypothetical protein BX661DRAFT_177277 [Kickxella alabastrina]|uniref:uncharacterized protein n=1 Tax=Kickxella alabastrina TaxID=61397 RepID=UPI00221F9BDA|nr:uncharacterized protein BX661DRAFT_177277 [Kickxella alabastrina]KAI7833646.1 hypothetical protein BX661DRAFT_177277 [Kickxella alabastrina]